MFWLSASAAWANGVITLKTVADPETWIYASSRSICEKNASGGFKDKFVKDCIVKFTGKFGGANGSVVSNFAS